VNRVTPEALDTVTRYGWRAFAASCIALPWASEVPWQLRVTVAMLLLLLAVVTLIAGVAYTRARGRHEHD
jgi:hypothetical protein